MEKLQTNKQFKYSQEVRDYLAQIKREYRARKKIKKERQKC